MTPASILVTLIVNHRRYQNPSLLLCSRASLTVGNIVGNYDSFASNLFHLVAQVTGPQPE
jgi:hypothetical protein